MKITLEQFGGLAGIRRRFTLDTVDLGEAREEVEALARAVGGQSSSSGSPRPDEMGYALHIAGDEGMREVVGTDAGASTEFGRLVEQVRKRGKAGAA